MAQLAIALWHVDANTLPNATVNQKINGLADHLTLAFTNVNDVAFRVFVVPEFYFMNANKGEKCIRWYTRAERDHVVREMMRLSASLPRLLLVAGTVCWYETEEHTFGRDRWRVYNESPVCYNGFLRVLHRKREWGGEVEGEDALRLYRARQGELDLRVLQRNRQTNQSHYVREGQDRPYGAIVDHTGKRLDGKKVAPGIEKAHDRYSQRIHYERGTNVGSFKIPGGTFVGGVEICMEHDRGVFKHSSPPTDIHIVTSNSAAYKATSVNVLDGGYFIHCDPQNKMHAMRVGRRQGNDLIGTPTDRWTWRSPKLGVMTLPMPEGL